MRKALQISLFLYLVSLLTSMAGMEIFGWLTFVLAFLVSWQQKSKESGTQAFYTMGPDYALIGLFIVVALGAYFNAVPSTDYTFMFGNLRWMILIYGLSYAFRWSRTSEKAFVPLMIIAGIVSIHGIQIYFTGWDFIRNEESFTLIGAEKQGRAAGFFTMPTTYAHCVAQLICFPVAAMILGWKANRWKKIAVAIATVLIFVSILLSFTRGAWIGVFCAFGAMTLFVNRKLFAGLLLTGLVLGATAVAVNPIFRERITSITDLKYESNSQRLEMWRAHWLMYKEHPILGLGLDQGEDRIAEYHVKLGDPDAHRGNAHNTYLQFLAGTGTLGTLCYLVFIGFYLVLTFRLWRHIPKTEIWPRVLVLGALGAQVAVHVGGLTDANFKDAEVQHQFIAILGMLSYLRFAYFKGGKADEKPLGLQAAR